MEGWVPTVSAYKTQGATLRRGGSYGFRIKEGVTLWSVGFLGWIQERE